MPHVAKQHAANLVEKKKALEEFRKAKSDTERDKAIKRFNRAGTEGLRLREKPEHAPRNPSAAGKPRLRFKTFKM